MLKLALALAAALLLSACSDRGERAREIITDRLPEKRYVEFRDLEYYPDDVICGEYQTTDPMRGTGRFRPFIVYGDIGEERPSPEERKIFCSEDAGAALQATLGIGPLSDPANHLSRIRDDLNRLLDALALYLEDNLTLPGTQQGLEALVTPSTLPPVPLRFREGGYLQALPLDPWQRPYQYEREGLGGGVAQEFQVYTLGADGAPGGSGQNADVSSAHLKYLEHIAR